MEREGIFTRVKLLVLSVLSGASIIVENQFKYDQAFTFTDPQSIPDLATVQAMLGSGINYQPFTEADLVADGFGGWKLPFGMVSPDIPLMIRIETSGNVKNLTPQFQNDFLFNFEDPALGSQTIYVYSTGTYVPPAPPPAAPVFSLQPATPLTIVRGKTLVLSVASSNTTSYQWYKSGVAISGETASTYTKTGFTSGDAATYYVVAIGAGGSTQSTSSVVIYDAGILLLNVSTNKSNGAPNGAGRIVTYNDGFYTGSINPGFFDRIRTATTSLDLRQGGSDSLTVKDASTTFAPMLGGNVSNIYVPPFVGGQIEIYNDN